MELTVWVVAVAVLALLAGLLLMLAVRGMRGSRGLASGKTISLDRITLRSQCLGLAGRPDRLIKTGGTIIPEEWKSSRVAPGADGGLFRPHRGRAEDPAAPRLRHLRGRHAAPHRQRRSIAGLGARTGRSDPSGTQQSLDADPGRSEAGLVPPLRHAGALWAGEHLNLDSPGLHGDGGMAECWNSGIREMRLAPKYPMAKTALGSRRARDGRLNPIGGVIRANRGQRGPQRLTSLTLPVRDKLGRMDQ